MCLVLVKVGDANEEIKDLIQLSTPGLPVCARHKSAPSWCFAPLLLPFVRVTSDLRGAHRYSTNFLLRTRKLNAFRNQSALFCS